MTSLTEFLTGSALLAIPLGAVLTALIPYGYRYLGGSVAVIAGFVVLMGVALSDNLKGSDGFALAIYMAFVVGLFAIAHGLKALVWLVRRAIGTWQSRRSPGHATIQRIEA